jgi:hypothetical protein
MYLPPAAQERLALGHKQLAGGVSGAWVSWMGYRGFEVAGYRLDCRQGVCGMVG